MRRSFLAFLLLTSGCDLLNKKDAGPTPTPTPSEPAKADDDKKWAVSDGTAPPPAEPPTGSWLAFESKEGAFKAEFPKAPSTESSQVPGGPGITVEMVTYAAELDDAYYAVATTDFPDAIINAKPAAVLLDGARDGAVANITGKLKEEKQIEVDGNPGRRLAITGNTEGMELLVDSVIFLKGKRLYQAIVVRPATKDITAETTRFLDSLHPSS